MKLEFLVYAADTDDYETVPIQLPKVGKLGKAALQRAIDRLKLCFLDALAEAFPGQVFHFVQIGPRKFKVFAEECEHYFTSGICDICNLKEEPMVTIQ